MKQRDSARTAPPPEAPSPGDGRRHRLWVGLLLNGGARALTVAAPMVTLPMVTHSLGRSTYGAYAVITSIVAFLPFAELGVGLGMITAVSRADGRRDTGAVRTITSTGFAMLSLMGAAVAAAALILVPALDWRAVLGITDPAVTGDVRLAVLFVALSFAVSLPANVGTKVMLGLQMNRAVAFWQAATVPVVIVAVAVGYLTSAGLPWFVFATLFSPHLVGTAATAWMFRRARPDVAPQPALVRRSEVGALLALGLAFAGNSAASAIGYSTDSIVISHIVGVDAVAVYNISARLSTVGLLVFQGLLLPLWPVFGARLAAGDFTGAQSRLRVAVVFSVGAGLFAAAAFVTLGPVAIERWVGVGYVPPTSLLIALAAWSVVEFAGYPFALLLSGAGAKGFILGTAVAMATTNLLLSIVLTQNFGMTGTTWASFISTVLFVLLPSVYYVKRHVQGGPKRPDAVPRQPS